MRAPGAGPAGAAPVAAAARVAELEELGFCGAWPPLSSACVAGAVEASGAGLESLALRRAGDGCIARPLPGGQLVAAVAAAASSPRLRRLTLAGVGASLAGAGGGLAAALRSCGALTGLDLSGNGLGPVTR